MHPDRQFALFHDFQTALLDQPARTGFPGFVVRERKHAEVRFAPVHRGHDVHEGRNGDRLMPGQEGQARFVRESAFGSLIGNTHATRAPSDCMSGTNPGKLVAIMSALSTVTGLRAARPMTRKLIAMR